MNTRLTASKITALRPKPSRYRVWDSEIQGFHVRISPKGRKTFVLTYRYEGFVKEFTIGTYGNLTIEEARRLAKKLAGQVADNIDVSAKQEKQKLTRMHGPLSGGSIQTCTYLGPRLT